MENSEKFDKRAENSEQLHRKKSLRMTENWEKKWKKMCEACIELSKIMRIRQKVGDKWPK